MKRIEEILDGVKTLGIGGHVRPDGDCVGSCMGLYLYLKAYHPEIAVDIYLDHPKDVFGYIACMDEIKMEEPAQDLVYDLFVTLDVSAKNRIALVGEAYDRAKKRVCIDHHVSNPGFGDVNYILSDVSSASEVLYTLLEPEKITKEIATAIYTGIVHDTGVFQYSSTSGETMRIAGELMETGFNFNKIIEQSFYEKTYIQNQVMGRVLAESIMVLHGKCIIGYMKRKDMLFYGVSGRELDGIVSQLRLTRGVEVAIFLYEQEPHLFKVSLRSNGKADVSKIATYFGGGGHLRAAGCDMIGSMYDVANNLTLHIEKQLKELGVLPVEEEMTKPEQLKERL